jgi:hypothetical protein
MAVQEQILQDLRQAVQGLPAYVCMCVCSVHAFAYSCARDAAGPAIENGAWPECSCLGAWVRVVSHGLQAVAATG